MPSSSDSSSLYTSTAQSDISGLPLLIEHSRHILAFKPLTFFRPLCIFVLCTLTIASCSRLSIYVSCSPSPLTPLGFFNGMLGVSELGALNFYTLFCLIPLTLFVSKNLTLIHLPLFGFLDSLLCNLIAPTPGLAFFLQMPRMLAAASSYSSGRAHSSRSFLPPLFLRLAPPLIM